MDVIWGTILIVWYHHLPLYPKKSTSVLPVSWLPAKRPDRGFRSTWLGGGNSGATVGQPEPTAHADAVLVSVPKKRGRKSNRERAAARRAAEGS